MLTHKLQVIEMAHRISRNRKYDGKNNSFIRSIEGVYRDLEHAVINVGKLKVFRMPDGSARLYDFESTDREIEKDAEGIHAIAIIEPI
jgi:hypothetical protein